MVPKKSKGGKGGKGGKSGTGGKSPPPAAGGDAANPECKQS